MIQVGHASPRQWLTKASGFLEGYSHTLNPYVGCVFACSYCYVRKMPVALFRDRPWGTWVDVKQAAHVTFERELARAKERGRVRIFMSSSTDPYQPIEHREQVTRALLEAMVANPPEFIFVQTRSPLVTRDIPLLQQFADRVLISVTVETDREDIRRAFTPFAPPISGRLSALEQLRIAGIPTQAAVAPVLPYTPEFPRRLSSIVERVCIDNYAQGDGSGGRRSEQLHMRDRYVEQGLVDWYEPEKIDAVYNDFLRFFSPGQVFTSRAGFLPPASIDDAPAT